jgi:hypothetical protein
VIRKITEAISIIERLLEMTNDKKEGGKEV